MLRRFSIIILCLLTISCGNDQFTNVESGTTNQVLHLGNATEPQDLDPHTVTGMPERRLVLALFENLLTKDTTTLEIKPAIADSWQVSSDKLIYTFYLRHDARWSNGDMLTAHDFVFSWNRILHPLLANEFAYIYYPILNAEQYNKGELEDFSQVGIRAIDDYTLEFVMDKPFPLFLDLVSDSSTVPVHQATIEKHGEIWNRGSAWTRPENYVSNGPFQLTDWIPNKVISMTAQEHYWDRSSVKLNEIHFYPVEDQSTEERMFRNGQLHMTYNVPLEKIAKYKEEDAEKLRLFPVYGTYFYLFNVTQPPFDDVRVRKALAMVIDRDQIVKNVTKGGELPAYSLSPLDPNGYKSNTGTEFNIDKARHLLADAGYPGGNGFPEFELIYNTSEAHKQVALAIQQMWLKSLNIKARLANQEWKVFLDNRKQLQYQVARAGSIGTFADPGDILESYKTGVGMNNTGWSNMEFDRLISEAMTTGGRMKRFQLFQLAEKILIEEMPVLPIYYYNQARLMSTDIKGWSDNLIDYPSFKNIYLSAEK